MIQINTNRDINAKIVYKALFCVMKRSYHALR